MLLITLDLATNIAKAVVAPTIRSGYSLPVTIACELNGVPSSPGSAPVFELGLGSDAAPPAILAYLGSFSAENESTFIGVLNANDARLVAFLTGKSTVAVNCQIQWTIAGVTQAAPNFSVTVQPPIIAPGAATEGGPVWLTNLTGAPLTQVDQTNGKTYRLAFVNGVPSSVEI
jgi:hypothetical protein